MPLKSFNIPKFISISKLLQEKSHSSSYLKILKLLFFADRYHIRHFGALMTFDTYVALPHGPAGSQSKNILLKDWTWLDDIQMEVKQYIYEIIDVDRTNRTVSIKESVNYNKISASEIEAIEFSINTFGEFSKYEIRDITHDYPEWKRYKYLFDTNQTSQEFVVVDDFFKNVDITKTQFLKNHFTEDPFYDDEDFLKSMLEGLQESKEISTLVNALAV